MVGDGRYWLGSVIGRGSSAIVRLGVDILTGERLAVKIMSLPSNPAKASCLPTATALRSFCVWIMATR